MTTTAAATFHSRRMDKLITGNARCLTIARQKAEPVVDVPAIAQTSPIRTGRGVALPRIPIRVISTASVATVPVIDNRAT